MIVVYCANRQLYKQLPTALNSLIYNNKNIKKIYLLIEDDSIPTITHELVEFINVNQFDFIIRSSINCISQFTYMAMVRCFLTKILKEDKVLYLDVDTVVDADLSELWSTDTGGKCVAGRDENDDVDISNRGVAHRYFNSGVLLMNLKYIRAVGLDDKVITLLKCCKMVFTDQDAMNMVFKGQVVYLLRKFNVIGCDFVYDREESITIRHYAGYVKPWKFEAIAEDRVFWNKYKVDSIQRFEDIVNIK